jgi:hypothetical protein
MDAELISEAFAAFACAENGHGRPLVQAYVVDDLVLAVTEHEHASAASHRHDAHGRSRAELRDPAASQRRTTVEAVTGRHVATTLSGRQSDPDVIFELFVLEPDDGTHSAP